MVSITRSSWVFCGLLAACTPGDDPSGETDETSATEGNTGEPAEPCEAEPAAPFENASDAHGWQASAGPACDGQVVDAEPPCWDGVCFETVLCTACTSLSMREPAILDGNVYLGSWMEQEWREAHRYAPGAGNWESLRAGVPLSASLVTYGNGWLAAYEFDGMGAFELRILDPETGHATGLGALTLPGNTPPGRPATQVTDALVFDSVTGGTGDRSLCAWPIDGQEPGALVTGLDTSTFWHLPSAELFGDWIYWANQRVAADGSEHGPIFEAILMSNPGGFTVVDDEFWFLNGPCGPESCGSTPPGLWRVDLLEGAVAQPQFVAADEYSPGPLVHSGTTLLWQRNEVPVYQPPGTGSQLVLYDIDTGEPPKVIFDFGLDESLSSYRVVGDHLYGVRRQAPQCLERLELTP